MKVKSRILCTLLLSALLLGAMPFSSYAYWGEPDYGEPRARAVDGGAERTEPMRFTRYELSVSKVYNKSIYAYSAIPVSRNGIAISADARMIGGEPYVAVRALAEYLGYTVTYRSASRTINVRGAGLDMDVIDGSNVIWANGRVLFSMTPSVIMTNGRMYAPVASLAKAFGLAYSFADGEARLSGALTPIRSASSYYAEDAVYWLSRIISAESRGESLLGQIAVGSVVMNRVNSPQYPNTIWGVIFDRKWGVQFSPILDGSIYSEPVATAVVAAKICLEGFNVNRDPLFFLYPRASTSSWIPNTRPYLFSIGKHDFYS